MLTNSLNYIKAQIKDFIPDTALILGSGLDGVSQTIENPLYINYAAIPDFPQTTVAGHKGRFAFGQIGSRKVICMEGRFHLYEGIAPQLIADIVGLLTALGVKELIITNAAGSLKTSMPAGSLMLIKDHINFSGHNPLIGPHDEPYFPDMSNAYDAVSRQKVKTMAQQLNIELFEGVYLMAMGPNYETPSEVKLFQLFGADAVGMSTVPEVIAAVHKGLKVLAFSVISNLGTGLTSEVQNHQDVLAQVQKSSKKLEQLLKTYLNQ